MPKIAIFASGKGSNTEHLINYFKEKNSTVEVGVVICNNPNAAVISLAKKLEVEVEVFDNKAIKEGEGLLEKLHEKKIDFIVLAGFLRKIPVNVISAYEHKIVNIHPSLLPKYGGKGMFGQNVHKAVILNKESESGISIHIVNEYFDKGELIFQAKCNVEKEETVESLALKIQELEHNNFGKVVESYILGYEDKV